MLAFLDKRTFLVSTHYKGEKFAILPGNPNHPATFLQNKFINKTEKWIAFLYTYVLYNISLGTEVRGDFNIHGTKYF